MAPKEIFICKVETGQQVPVLLADGGVGRGVLGPVAWGLVNGACLYLFCVSWPLAGSGGALGGAGGGGRPGLVFGACQAPTGNCAHHLLSL